MKFKDKVVLITGASRGIGRTLALYFGKEGANVVVNYLSSEKKALKVVENIKKFLSTAIAIKCDIANEEEVKSMIEETIKTFGKIDILVNNAGISSDVPIFERTAEQWKRTLDVNLIGTFLCSKYAILEMLKNKDGGKIINLASINGTKHFYPEQIDYDVSKAGIISLTKILAKASGPKISVNAIAPGNIDNYDEETPSGNPTEEDLNKIYSRRYGKITEIAKTVLFLASDNASFINGITLFLDGGCD